MATSAAPVIVAGGGIGGLAAALTLARGGRRVRVLEQASGFEEMGAGLQLGPNASRLLRDWGVLGSLAPDLVAPAEVRMMDGVSGEVIGRIPLGEDFERRFGAPYYVARRADLHRALHTACLAEPAITLTTNARVERYANTPAGVVVHTHAGEAIEAAALVGADGIRSSVRAQILGDGPPEFAGHVAYRALIDAQQMPRETAWSAATVWAAPGAHLVHYPISGGRRWNIVAVATYAWRGEGWATEVAPGEVLDLFRSACDPVRRVLEAAGGYRKWALADRAPAARWSDGRVTLLGDAAHAVLPYLAQGAVMALEDAQCLADSLAAHGDDVPAAFRAYEERRKPRTARLRRESRYLGTVYHARGVRRFARNLVMRRQTPDRWYARMNWIYGGP